MIKEVVIVYVDDWEGIYIDGKLTNQNHYLSTHDILTAVEIPYTMKQVSYEWMKGKPSFPKDLKDVVLIEEIKDA